MKTKPFFSGNVYECASDGSVPALSVRKYKKLQAFDEHLLLEKDEYPFVRFTKLDVSGDVLSMYYIDKAGKHAEKHVKYEKFLPGRGSQELLALVKRVAERIPTSGHTSYQNSASQPSMAVRAERSGAGAVKVYGSKVAFPSLCPECLAPASLVARLDVSSRLDSGIWLVPVCPEHTGRIRCISVKGWRSLASTLTFVFSNQNYADEFHRLNASDKTVSESASAVHKALLDIKAGTRFIVYLYVTSIIVVCMRHTSDICVVGRGESRFLRGISYSLISLLLGWWSIPHGPIFTFGSIITNCRGGIDLTNMGRAAIRGERVSAFGV